MKFIEDIRLRLGLFFLKRHAGKVNRTSAITSYHKVRSVVLLFKTDEFKIPAPIESLTQAFARDNKKVFQIIYFEGDINRLQYAPHERRIIFTRKDLNFLRIPNPLIIEGFKRIEGDYLIDLSLDEVFPIMYLLGMSSVKCKVGKQSELRLKYCDLLINDKTNTLQEFIQHLLHYLKILKTNHDE